MVEGFKLIRALSSIVMSQASNPHRGFDYATTINGEAVPTRFERDLARTLKGLSDVSVVGWSGTRKAIDVIAEEVEQPLKAVCENIKRRESDAMVKREDATNGHRITVRMKR